MTETRNQIQNGHKGHKRKQKTESDEPWLFASAPNGVRNRIQKLFTSHSATWLGPFYQTLGTEFSPARREPWSSRLWRRVTGSQTDQVGELFKYLHFGRVCVVGHSDELISTLDLWSGFVSSLQISLESRLPIGDIAAAFRLEPVNDLRIVTADNLDQWSRLNKPCLARVEWLTVEMPNEHNRQTVKVVEDILRQRTPALALLSARANAALRKNAEQIEVLHRAFNTCPGDMPTSQFFYTAWLELRQPAALN